MTQTVTCTVGALWLMLAAAAGADRQLPADADPLERTRQELGGERLAAIRTLRIEGQSTRVAGPLRLTSTIEFLLDRPDRFLRIDRLRMPGSSAETAAGFVGDRFVQRMPGPRAPSPADALSGEQAAELRQAAAAGLRKEMQLLLLGFFAGTFDGSLLGVERMGPAEAPDGQAEAFRLSLAGGPDVTLFVEAGTHLPLMASWEGADLSSIVRLATATDAARTNAVVAAAVTSTVEHRLHFSDYRRIGGLTWPYLIRHTAGGEAVEELRFDRFTLNPVFNARTFAGNE